MNQLTLQKSQWINKPVSEVFAFFSEAQNLERITPPYLQFKILNTSTKGITKNTLIDYRLKLHGIPFHWKTRINDFIPNKMFIDEQLKGPYKKWVHTHSFKEKDGGTLIEDNVIYEIPGGIVGEFLLKSYIKKDLEKIFTYRQEIIKEIFKES